MGTAPLTHSRDVSQHKVQLVLAAAWEAITRLKSVGCAAGHPPCNNSMMNDERNGEKAKGESLLPDPRGRGFPSDCPPEIDARIIANLLYDSGLRRKPVRMSEKSRGLAIASLLLLIGGFYGALPSQPRSESLLPRLLWTRSPCHNENLPGVRNDGEEKTQTSQTDPEATNRADPDGGTGSRTPRPACHGRIHAGSLGWAGRLP